MKEKRSLFSRIFGSEENNEAPTYSTTFQLLDNRRSVFTTYTGDFENDIDVLACVDAIARNGAKFHAKHIRNGEDKFEILNDYLYKILSKQPNRLQNAYKFYYQVISDYALYNNSYIYIKRDVKTNRVDELYPLSYRQIRLLEHKNELYIEFKFGNGKTRVVPYKSCIHLTRLTSEDGMYGGSTRPIVKTLGIKHVIDEGIVNAIKTTQDIKGIVKSTKSMMKADDVKKMRDQFVDDFIKNGDGSGIGGLDALTEFTPVKLDPKTADEYQLKEVNDKILSYFGVNEKIIQSKYSEDEWNAFYESVLEPIAIQMSHEFTNKIFTPTEIYHGNEIVFESNRLQYASNNTKISLLRYANNIMTINELREVFNLTPVEDGDKILQDLNHIDSDIANKYQLNEDGDTNEGGDTNEEGN